TRHEDHTIPDTTAATQTRLHYHYYQHTQVVSHTEIMNVEHEVTLLIEHIKRLGTESSEGQYSVEFGVLFNDDECANVFEALVGTLRAAKRKKIITFEGELLLQGVHDKVPIKLLKDKL
ncbi:unnamed protein product, partial [Meganyctiphanes norvegica]